MSDAESKSNPLDKYKVTRYSESKGDDGHVHHEFDVYHGGPGSFGSFDNKHGAHVGRIYMSHPAGKPHEAKVTETEITKDRYHNKPEIHAHLENEAKKLLANHAGSKVVAKSNGQWELEKGSSLVPNHPHSNYDIYSLITNPNEELPKIGGEAGWNKNSAKVLNHISDLHSKDEGPYSTKSMKNLDTGNLEPHVLLHRGISTNTDNGDNPAKEPSPADNKPNDIDWSKPGIVSSSHYNVHSLNQHEADSYATHGDNDGNSHNQSGIRHSFWVPVSKINAGTHFDSDVPSTHMVVKPGNFRQHESVKFKNGKQVKE